MMASLQDGAGRESRFYARLFPDTICFDDKGKCRKFLSM
jgi:hypothetical protein